jgi:hypothetical protein
MTTARMSASDGAATSPLTRAPPLLLKRQRNVDCIAPILETAKLIGSVRRVITASGRLTAATGRWARRVAAMNG